MPQISADNRRIAKNTAYLYVRMVIMTAVGLYSSRLVLEALGARDFGIYNVVGGMVVLFAFFKSTLTSATQRFLNFYLGKGDKERTNTVFCMSMNIYILLLILIVFLAETIGMWFLNNHLNIPEERMSAARWVFQLAIAQFVIETLRIPYNASIIAYEKMNFFAYASLLEAAMKLLIAFTLYVTIIDRLVSYSILFVLTSIVMTIMYREYCRKKLDTTHYMVIWDKHLFKDIFHYSSWTSLDAIAIVFSAQGRDIILNLFYGVTLNAAAGVANQVSAHVYAFVSNFQVAFQPQIIQTYAANKIEEFHSLISRACRFSYLLFLAIATPLFFSLDKILSIWLVEVPQYTFEFCQLILVSQAIDSLRIPMDVSINATGKVRNQKIGICIIRFLNLPLIYLVMWLGFAPYSIWYVWGGVVALQLLFTCHMASGLHSFSLIRFTKEVLLPIILVTLLSIPVPYVLRNIVEGFWVNLFVVIITSLIVTATLILYIGMSTKERTTVIGIIAAKLHIRRE